MKTIGKGIAIIVCCLAAALFLWFSIPIYSGVSNIGNELGLVFSLLVIGVTLLIIWLKRRGKGRAATVLTIIGSVLVGLILLWAAVISVLMISGAAPKEHDASDTVIVLGCKVKGETPSLHLSRRIEAAAEYLESHPEANCIASGGKGDGEQISEAEAIYRGLVAKGIAPNRIVKEERSVNTLENLTYSKEILGKTGWKQEVVLVTDEFHQYRAGRIAEKLGMTTTPVSAKHIWHTFPANYSRELLAITKEILIG